MEAWRTVRCLIGTPKVNLQPPPKKKKIFLIVTFVGVRCNFVIKNSWLEVKSLDGMSGRFRYLKECIC
jgi:hypothetical protein